MSVDEANKNLGLTERNMTEFLLHRGLLGHCLKF